MSKIAIYTIVILYGKVILILYLIWCLVKWKNSLNKNTSFHVYKINEDKSESIQIFGISAR